MINTKFSLALTPKEEIRGGGLQGLHRYLQSSKRWKQKGGGQRAWRESRPCQQDKEAGLAFESYLFPTLYFAVLKYCKLLFITENRLLSFICGTRFIDVTQHNKNLAETLGNTSLRP